MVLKIQMIKSSDATAPAYAHKGDAGVDLYSSEEQTLEPMERKLVPTGLKMAIPEGHEGQIRPKSGLSINHGITCVNAVGTIDSGYRGEIKVPLINLSKEQYKIEKGKKIAQMVFAKVEEAQFEETTELEDSFRKEGGFGSTGLD